MVQLHQCQRAIRDAARRRRRDPPGPCCRRRHRGVAVALDGSSDSTLAKLDLLRHRLYNQQLTRPQFETAAEVVAWLGAVQSQEYLGAIWSVGQRMISA